MIIDDRTDAWQKRVDDCFFTLDEAAADEVALMGGAMIVFEATRNSYPDVVATDVADYVAGQLATSLHIRRLIEAGQVERFTADDGIVRYRRTRL